MNLKYRAARSRESKSEWNTPNLPTNIVEFKGFDPNIILIIRGGILRPIGDLPESLSEAMLVGCNISREIGRSMKREP